MNTQLPTTFSALTVSPTTSGVRVSPAPLTPTITKITDEAGIDSITRRRKPAPSSTTYGSTPKAATSPCAKKITGMITVAASAAATTMDCPGRARLVQPLRRRSRARPAQSVPVPTAVMVTDTPPRICAPVPTTATDGAPKARDEQHVDEARPATRTTS